MATGYTADVASGKVTEFSEYALICARAFGALIEMRDEPSDAEIPEAFDPSDYHEKALKKSEHELEMFLGATDEILATRMESKFRQEVDAYEKRLKENRQTRERYEAMLEKARAYQSPSPDHDSYAKFLVEQLESSIEWDCKEPSPPKKQSLEEWKDVQEKWLRWNVHYHMRELASEIERTDSRNDWIAKLRASLDSVAVPAE